jgi:membrane protease YdiL (CAAX protease family)
MSIIGLIGTLGVSQERFNLILGIAATLVALGIFIKSRAYRPRSICGPSRLDPEEPLGPFVFIMIGGLSLWMLVPAVILKFLHRGVRLEDIKAGPRETVILGIVGQLVPFLFMLLGTFTRRQRGLATIGLTRRNFLIAWKAAVAGFIFILPLVSYAALVSDWWLKKHNIEHPMKHELLEIMDKSPGPLMRILIAFGAIIVAPLFEEFLFRAHLQTLLSRVTRQPWIAVIITSILFSLVHHWSIWLPIFTLSLCLGYMYERTANLWVTILMHAMFNGFSIAINLLVH